MMRKSLKQIKKLDDEKIVENVETLVRNNLDAREDVNFDFDADVGRMIQKLSVKQLVKGNRKHAIRFKSDLIKLEKGVYMPLTVQMGIKNTKRFNRLFMENK
jgi:hypothetical protein